MTSQLPAAPRVFMGVPANDNFTDGELPTTIPPDKAAQRREIERLTAGHPVTTCPPGKRPTGLTAWRPVSKPANDNRAPQSWPLAETLRRAGREADIEVCEAYRALWAIMNSDPLQGHHPNMDEDEEPGINVETRSTLTEEMTDIQYKEVRQIARTPGASTKAVRKGDGDGGDRYHTTTARFSEDTLIAQIDMREAWARLRAATRPLLAAFEDACLDGATMTEIGEARGFNGKQASAAGKALVFEAIGALSGEWVAIRREARQLEEQADRNAIRFRARRERAVAAYLGKAA